LHTNPAIQELASSWNRGRGNFTRRRGRASRLAELALRELSINVGVRTDGAATPCSTKYVWLVYRARHCDLNIVTSASSHGDWQLALNQGVPEPSSMVMATMATMAATAGFVLSIRRRKR
jgi:hypothetical protein